MEVQVNTLTPELFLELYTSVGWEPPCIAQVKRALENTIATFTAYDNGQAVGMVRLIGDGGIFLYQRFCGRTNVPINGRGNNFDGSFGRIYKRNNCLWLGGKFGTD